MGKVCTKRERKARYKGSEGGRAVKKRAMEREKDITEETEKRNKRDKVHRKKR